MFGNLTYNNKVVKPSLRPVEAIAGMYNTQTKNYEYAIDNINKGREALTSISVDENTKHVVQGATEALNKAIEGVVEKGDYENYALASKQLTHDLANKHGLNAVQNYNTQKTARQEELKALAEEGFGDRARQYAKDDQRNNKPLRYDKELGRWEGGYSGRNLIKQTDWGEKLLELTDGFQADVLPFEGPNKELIIKDPNGSGYVYSGSLEKVSEEDLYEFSKAYLAGNPQFKSELQEDIYFDLSNRLYDEETGSYRTMTADDVKQALPDFYLNHARNVFELGKGDLAAELNKKGITPEQFYAEAKAEEKVRTAAIPAMHKEGFNKLKLDWDAPKEGDSSGANFIGGMTSEAMLDTQYTVQRSSYDDLVNMSKLHNTAQKDLIAAETKLREIETSTTRNPQAIAEQRAKVEEQKRIINTTIDNQSRSLDLAPEVKKDIEGLATGLSREVPGIDASFTVLQKLIYKQIAGEEITDLELEALINDEKLIEHLYSLSPQNIEASSRTVTDYVTNQKQRSKNALRGKIKQFGSDLKATADEGQIKYTESFNSVIFKDMTPEQRRNHPIYQLEYMTDGMSEQTEEYYRKFSHPSDQNLPIGDYIKHELKTWDKVHWDKVKVNEIIDAARDSKGNFRPTVTLTIPVSNGDENKTITVPAFVEDEGYNALYFEAINAGKAKLAQKKAVNGSLSETEQKQLDKFNATLFDTTKEGTTFPNAELYNAGDGDIVEVGITNGKKARVEVSTSGNANGFTYFVLGRGGTDSAGNPVQTYWATDKQGNQLEVTKEELNNPNFTPIGGNTPYDLRVMMGEMTSATNNPGSSTLATVDLSTIFKADIKQGVIPKIAADLASSAQNLKTTFPGLIITDALRFQDVDYGADDSLHKEARALDFRLNEDSQKLLTLSPEEKRKYNIKSVGLHNDNHIHLEFL